VSLTLCASSRLIQVCEFARSLHSYEGQQADDDCDLAAYEGITIAAFLLLLVEFVSTTAAKGDVHNALARKDKEGLPMTVRLKSLLRVLLGTG
jgi:hypothetical protein